MQASRPDKEPCVLFRDLQASGWAWAGLQAALARMQGVAHVVAHAAGEDAWLSD